TTTEVATDTDPNTAGVQLPTKLGGTTVRVKGVLAPLLFVSPIQVNFVVPDSIAPSSNEDDLVLIEVANEASAISSVRTLVTDIAPAVFTMDGSGKGNPNAYLVRAKNGQVQDESLIGIDAATGQRVFKSIDFGAQSERVFLVLFLSGVRKAPDPNQDGNLNETIHVKFNGFEATQSYKLSKSSLIRLEHINVEIPRKFRGNQQPEIQLTGVVPSNRTVVTLNVPPLTEAHWRASGIEGQDVHSFAAAGETLVAGAARGIYRLGDDGTYWAESPYSFPTGEQKRR